MSFEVNYISEEGAIRVVGENPSFKPLNKIHHIEKGKNYAITIYLQDGPKERMQPYETIWLHPSRAKFLERSIEERVIKIANQKLPVDELYMEIEGYLDGTSSDLVDQMIKREELGID